MNVWYIVIQCTIVLGFLPKDTRPHPNTLPIRSLPSVNFWVFHLRDLSSFLIRLTWTFTFHHYFIVSFFLFSISYTFVDPAFWFMCFPLDGGFDFDFEKWFYLLKKWIGVATYFCFIFKKGKQNKKENPKCDSLFWKRWYMKNRIELRGLVYLSGRYDKDRNTPLSP